MARENSKKTEGKKTFGGFMLIFLFALIGGFIGSIGDYLIKGKTGIWLALGAGCGAAVGMAIGQRAGLWPKQLPRHSER